MMEPVPLRFVWYDHVINIIITIIAKLICS